MQTSEEIPENSVSQMVDLLVNCILPTTPVCKLFRAAYWIELNLAPRMY
jgi:hypothetical protein